MRERLEYIKVDPAWVLDAGSGVGHDLSQLKSRFPEATLIALDANELALGRCSGVRNFRPGPLSRFFARPSPTWCVCADFAAMPLRSLAQSTETDLCGVAALLKGRRFADV